MTTGASRGASPRVSVLVPTFRYARFMVACIESVLAQTFTDFELLIRDDNSGDGTDEIGERYARLDPRVRYVRNPENLGMVANWNRALKDARAPYVKYLFGDDLIPSPHCLERMVEVMDREPTVSLVGSSRVLLDEEGKAFDLWRYPGPTGLRSGPRVIYTCLRDTVNYIGEPSAVLFRKADGARGFHPAYRQLVDLEMWFYLLTKGDFWFIEEPLCGFRVHGAQQTAVNKVSGVHKVEQVMLVRDYFDRSSGPLRSFEKWRLTMRSRLNLLKMLQGGDIGEAEARDATGDVNWVIGTKLMKPLYKTYRPVFRKGLKLARFMGWAKD